MNAMIIAFSMYSKIPMPRVGWNEKNMRYAMCFFPWIGVVIGAVSMCAYFAMQQLHCGTLAVSAILLVIPLLITGGIHMDGYLDTMDALSSYQERERKLEILKDSNSGAFAIIGCVIYYLIALAFMSEISWKSMWLLACGYAYSRTLSAFGVVTLRGAKNTGLLAAFSSQAQKRNVRIVMVSYGILLSGLMIWIGGWAGVAVILAGLGTFVYYRYKAYKEFGGITGDLAGYFVQICELMILIVAVSMNALIGIK